MILSAEEILKAIENGDIVIDPFNESQLNPNSYNLKLHNELFILKDSILDMKKESSFEKITIPEAGIVLEPGELYLGRTLEYTETRNYVPLIEGRSSLGRLGISIHSTAGFGDVGFKGYWTLEISVVKPVRIYPFVEVCQIYYCELKGKAPLYKGKYQDSRDIKVSQMFKEF